MKERLEELRSTYKTLKKLKYRKDATYGKDYSEREDNIFANSKDIDNKKERIAQMERKNEKVPYSLRNSIVKLTNLNQKLRAKQNTVKNKN